MAGLAMGPLGWDSYWSAPMYNKLVPNFTKRVGRNPNRHRWKRGGRWKTKRRQCVTGKVPEKKFVDAGAQTLAPQITGQALVLSNIVQGITGSTRIGRKATITNINVKGMIHLASGTSATTQSNRVRLCLVWDHSTNGATFSGSDVFATAGTSDINAYRALDNLGRFTILWDKTFTINTSLAGVSGAVLTSEAMRNFNMSVKCCIPIEYDDPAGAHANQLVNSISLLAYEEQTVPSTTIQFTRRVRFID